MPARKKTKSPPVLYKVTIDYKNAGVNEPYKRDQARIYESRAGVGQYIKPALEVGVHPRHIKVEVMPATWAPDPDYDQLCPVCKSMYDSPNDDCPQMTVIARKNAERVRHRDRSGNPLPPLDTPHPVIHMIPEAFVVEDVL